MTNINMEQHWAFIKQIYYELESICPAIEVSASVPADSQKEAYASLISKLFTHYQAVMEEAQNKVKTLDVYHKLPPELGDFRKNVFLPNLDNLLAAFESIDEISYGLLEWLYPYVLGDEKFRQLRLREKEINEKGFTIELMGKEVFIGGKHLNTPIKKILMNASEAFSKSEHVTHLVKPLDSLFQNPIFGFEPDEWLDRVQSLSPVVVYFDNKSKNLPSHIVIRLREIFCAYIHGNWISVIVNSRAILEYSLLDNAKKFSIPDSDKCKLGQLIDFVSDLLIPITDKMKRIQEEGNCYIHPKLFKTNIHGDSKRTEETARIVVANLVECLEAIYAYQP